MFKYIVKQLWKNRKANGWIFAELTLVTAILWQIADATYVDTKVYHSPLGYDIENVWFFYLENLGENAPGYAGETDGAEDLIYIESVNRLTFARGCPTSIIVDIINVIGFN